MKVPFPWTYPAAAPRFREERRVEFNSAWLLLNRIVLQLQTALLTILVARQLGEAAFGQYSLIASLIFFGNVLTTFGTDTHIIRRVAQVRRMDIPEIPSVLGLQLAGSVLVVGAVWAWIYIAPQNVPEYSSALHLYSLSLFPLAFFSIFSAILRGLERMDLALITSLGTAVVQLGVVWIVLHAGSSLPVLMGALLAVQIFAAVFSYALCRMTGPIPSIHWNLDFQLITRILHAVWPLAVLSILGVAYQRLGIFTLSFFGSDAQVGLFSAASRIVEALKLGHIAVLGALLPAFVRLQQNPGGNQEVRRLFQKATMSLIGLGLLASVVTTFIATPLVSLLYGAHYDPAVPALQALVWLLVPYSLSSILTVRLIAQRKEKFVIAALALCLAAAAVLSLWWIPLWGVQGACLAVVGGETVQCGILWSFRER